MMDRQRSRETMKMSHVPICIFDHIQQPTFVLDCDGRVIVWNASIEEYTGVSEEDIIGQGNYAHAEALFGEKRPTLADCILTQSDPGSDHYRLQSRYCDELFAEPCLPLISGRRSTCMAAPLYDPEGRLVGAVETIQDTSKGPLKITAWAPEEEMRILEKTLSDMIFTLNKDGVFLRFLWIGGKEVGIDPADMVGKTPNALLPEGEAEYLSGAARRVIESGEPITETRSFTWDGKCRSFQVTIHPLHDVTGTTIETVIGVARDITSELLYKQTLQDMGHLSNLYLDLLGTDIYNTSMVAATVIDMLRERLSGEEAELAQRVKSTIEQGITVIKNVELLNTLNKHSIRVEPIDLDGIIRDQIQRYSGIDIRYEGRRCIVWANPLLEHVVSNLISNSIKFGGMKVRIEIEAVEIGDIVTLSVADNGIGIPDHLKLSIFDRFSRGSKTARGSRGLGLHIVKTLVDQYGGRVWASDRIPGKPGEGAAIKVILQMC